MSSPKPQTSKSLVVQKASAAPTSGWAAEQSRFPYKFDAVLVEKPIPELKSDEVLVKINAVAFNHKDVCPACFRISPTQRSNPDPVILSRFGCGGVCTP